MNTFLIAFSALLAVCSVCDAYAPKASAYAPASAVSGGIVYRQQPRLSVSALPTLYGAPLLTPSTAPLQSGYAAPPASGYGTPLASGYGAPLASGYGAPLASGYGAPLASGYVAPLASAYGAPVLNVLSDSQLAALAGGYRKEIDLANQALAIPVPNAVINLNPVLGLTKVYAPAAPVVIPAPAVPAPSNAYAPASSVY